jgi:hypothetical protein
MSEHEIKLMLQSSKELWWWQRLLVARRIHGVLRQLVLDHRIEYRRYEARRRNDKARFKYSLTLGDTSPAASRKTTPV